MTIEEREQDIVRSVMCELDGLKNPLVYLETIIIRVIRLCDADGHRRGLAAAKAAVEAEVERQYEKACEFDAPGLAVAASMRAAGCSMAVAAIDRLGEKP